MSPNGSNVFEKENKRISAKSEFDYLTNNPSFQCQEIFDIIKPY